MRRNQVNVSFDGRKNGIAVFVKNQQKILKCKIKDGKLVPKLFRSVKLAKIFLHKVFGINNPNEYSLMIIIDGKRFKFDDCGYYHDQFIIYDHDEELNQDIKYIVSESVNDKVVSIGYICFYNAEIESTEHDMQQQVVKYIFQLTEDAIQNIVLDNSYIARQYKDNNKVLCADLKNCSGKIHVCNINKIVQLNQQRKEQGIRCLPFDKNMDGFNSLYFYLTKDMFEPDGFETTQLLNTCLNMIIDEINDSDELVSAYASQLEFKGEILL